MTSLRRRRRGRLRSVREFLGLEPRVGEIRWCGRGDDTDSWWGIWAGDIGYCRLLNNGVWVPIGRNHTGTAVTADADIPDDVLAMSAAVMLLGEWPDKDWEGGA